MPGREKNRINPILDSYLKIKKRISIKRVRIVSLFINAWFGLWKAVNWNYFIQYPRVKAFACYSNWSLCVYKLWSGHFFPRLNSGTFWVFEKGALFFTFAAINYERRRLFFSAALRQQQGRRCAPNIPAALDCRGMRKMESKWNSPRAVRNRRNHADKADPAGTSRFI